MAVLSGPHTGFKTTCYLKILSNEKIDTFNKVDWLKRLGRKTIASPTELVMA